QDFILQQPQAKVSVTAGQTLILNCTTSEQAGPGPVRWLKGWGSGNQTIYDQKGYSLPRVTRAVNGSNTDFTIHIRNVQPEDMGTYYCVKFVKGDSGEDEVFQQGNGTEVSVQAKPSPPLMSGPGQRAGPEQTVPFACTSGGFFPEKIKVKWLRAEPSPVEVNKTVTFTCLLKEFYPANVSVSWLENGIEMKVENVSRPSELPRGLFQLRSRVEVQATEERNGSTITCMVVHDAQAPANYSAFLWISNPAQG
ncbi:SHPS1 phosphatase, partial [Polioptila caerulea]|nr:SHPS1 phosphatase [Polioptila caerulea]